MSSEGSSTWGSPESVKDESDFLPSNTEVPHDGTEVPRSGLEALLNYESPTAVRPIDVNFSTVEEEDTFLYGNFSLKHEELLETNEAQPKKLIEEPNSLKWSDEDGDCEREEQTSEDEEENRESYLSDFSDALKSDYVKNKSNLDDFEKSEDDLAKEFAPLDQQQFPSQKLQLCDDEKEIKYSHTEGFLKAKQSPDKTNTKSGLGISNSSEEIDVASESGNNMQKKYEQLNFLQNQCNQELKNRPDSDNFEKTDDGLAKECGSLDQQQFPSQKLELSDDEKEIKYSHTEGFLKAKQTTDETNSKSELGIPNSSEEINIASASENNMQMKYEQQKLLQNQCNQKLKNRDQPAVPSGSQTLSLSSAAAFLNALIGEGTINNAVKLNSDVEESSQPVTERSILLKHSKISSQTEKIVLKTCDKTSSTIVSNTNPRKAFPEKNLDTIRNYTKGTSRGKSHSQSEYVQDSNTNSGGVFGSKTLSKSPSGLSSNFESFHQSSPKPKQAIRYDECGKFASKNIAYKATRYESSKYKRRSSYDHSPQRRSRRRSKSYSRSPTHSLHSKYRPRRSRHKSPSHQRMRRHSRSRSRSHHLRSSHHSRDKTRYSRDRRSRERNTEYKSYERGRRSPYSGKSRNFRSRSRDSVERSRRTGSLHRSSSYKYRRSNSSDEIIKSHKVKSRERSSSRRRSRSRSSYSSSSFFSSSFRSSSTSP